MHRIHREVEIEASPDEVWEALATEEGRESWLEPDPDRRLEVETEDAPERLVWWWWKGNEQPRKVELRVIGVPLGTRVVVIETEPSFPLPALCAAFARVPALA